MIRFKYLVLPTIGFFISCGASDAQVGRAVIKAAIGTGAKSAAKSGAGKAALETLAKKFGSGVYTAGEKVGAARAATLIKEAGHQGGTAVRILGRYGDDAAHLVTPSGLAKVGRFGDDFVVASVKHPAAASRVAEDMGKAGLKAMTSLSSRGGRRLALMSQPFKTLPKSQAEAVLAKIAKHGEGIVNWLWNNKAKASFAVLAAVVLTQPEAAAAGTATIISASGQATGQIIESGGKVTVKPMMQGFGTGIGESVGESVSEAVTPAVAEGGAITKTVSLWATRIAWCGLLGCGLILAGRVGWKWLMRA